MAPFSDLINKYTPDGRKNRYNLTKSSSFIFFQLDLFQILTLILVLSSTCLHLSAANDANHDTSKTKKIQIVYIKVPLANKVRNNDGNYAESNSPAGYAVADTSSSTSNVANSASSQPSTLQEYNQQNLAADLVAMLKNQNNNGYNGNQYEGNNNYGSASNYDQGNKPQGNYQPAVSMNGPNDGFQGNGFRAYPTSGNGYNQVR